MTEYRPARIDYRGLVLIVSGVALSVFGFQQSAIWGWGDPATWACIVGRRAAAGRLLLRRAAHRLAADAGAGSSASVRSWSRTWCSRITMLVFVPVFFFASEYAQIASGKSPSEAGLYILYFFLGFVVAAQIGGRMLDRIGAKRPVVLGCALAAVGFWPLGRQGDRPRASAPSSWTSSSPAPAWG